MTGPEHYAEAERLMGEATRPASAVTAAQASNVVALAQAHATLALAAATAMGSLPLELAPRDVDAWDVVT